MPKQASQAVSFTGNLTSKPRSAVGNFPFREHHDDPIIQLGSSRIRGVLRGPQGRWLHDSAHNRITDGIFAPVSVERPSSLRAAYRRVMVHHAQEPHWGHCEEGERARLRESKRGEDEESERLTGTVGGRAHRFRWLSMPILLGPCSLYGKWDASEKCSFCSCFLCCLNCGRCG